MQILSKLRELQIVDGKLKVKPEYILAIANNVRCQIEESHCTIATTKLVMTWSALMTVYILSKLVNHLVLQGPVISPFHAFCLPLTSLTCTASDRRVSIYSLCMRGRKVEHSLECRPRFSVRNPPFIGICTMAQRVTPLVSQQG